LPSNYCSNTKKTWKKKERKEMSSTLSILPLHCNPKVLIQHFTCLASLKNR
jgi:hypothetical protein